MEGRGRGQLIFPTSWRVKLFLSLVLQARRLHPDGRRQKRQCEGQVVSATILESFLSQEVVVDVLE